MVASRPIDYDSAGARLTFGILLLAFIVALHAAAPYDLKKVEVGPSVIHVQTEPNVDGKYHPLQYTEQDMHYLQEALYFEAQGEPLECQEMIGHVIITRMYDWAYPNTIQGVVWDHRQFSYTHDGKHERMLSHKERIIAGHMAHLVLSGLSVDNTEGSLYYFNPDLADPDWQHDYTFVTQCGKHKFFKRKETRVWG